MAYYESNAAVLSQAVQRTRATNEAVVYTRWYHWHLLSITR